MTPYGIALAKTAARNVCDEAVRNGMLYPGGRVQPALVDEIKTATRNEGFDGVLSAGYLVHVGRIEDISSADRANRIMPAMSVWGAGAASAIHFANINIVISE